MHSRRAASKEQHQGAQQRANRTDKGRPRGSAILGTAIGTVVIDVAANDGKQHKVDNHDGAGDQESQQGDHGSQEGSHEPGAEGEDERDEVEAAGDGVQDHGLGQGARGVIGVIRKGGGGAGDVEGVGGLVAYVGVGADVTER